MDGDDDILTRSPSPPRSPKFSTAPSPTPKLRVASTSSTAPLIPASLTHAGSQSIDTVQFTKGGQFESRYIARVEHH